MSDVSKRATGAPSSEHEIDTQPSMQFPIETEMKSSDSESTLSASSPPQREGKELALVPVMPPLQDRPADLRQYIRLFTGVSFKPENPSPPDLNNIPPGVVAINHTNDGRDMLRRRRGSKRRIGPSNPSIARQKKRARNPIDTGSTAARGITPYKLHVKPGEDVVKKIMELAYSGPHTIFILSSYGTIGSVKLGHSDAPGRIVNYEGRFDIVSLSGFFTPTEDKIDQTRKLAICLHGQQEAIFGGLVSGAMIAATNVQVVIGSFVGDGQGEPGVEDHVELL